VAFGPKGIWAHKAVKADLEAIWQEWLALRHPYKITRAECFVPRHQYHKAKYPLSIHSWGCAIDANPLTNMPGMKGDLPPEFIDLFEKRGWRWGGRYKKADPTHLEAYTGKSF
jgi:hypothetical protein